MPRYGRIVGGHLIDVYDADGPEVLERRMAVSGFVEVPPETVHGAIPTLDGGAVISVTNPVVVPAARTPRELSKFEFINLFTTQEQAAAIALKATTLAVFWLNYDAATAFERDHPATIAGLSALQATEVISAERKAEILANWPTV